MQAASSPKTSDTACRQTQHHNRAFVKFRLPRCGNFTELKYVPFLVRFQKS